MTIDELIKVLYEAKDKEGNLDITVFSGAAVSFDFELRSGCYMRKKNKDSGKWETVNTLCFLVPKKEEGKGE